MAGFFRGKHINNREDVFITLPEDKAETYRTVIHEYNRIVTRLKEEKSAFIPGKLELESGDWNSEDGFTFTLRFKPSFPRPANQNRPNQERPQ